jgi:hypothetical protein
MALKGKKEKRAQEGGVNPPLTRADMYLIADSLNEAGGSAPDEG